MDASIIYAMTNRFLGSYCYKGICLAKRISSNSSKLLFLATTSTIHYGTGVKTYLFWRIPGVSKKISCVLSTFRTPKTLSRVVLTLWLTADSFFPTKLLRRVLFPEFGAPQMPMVDTEVVGPLYRVIFSIIINMCLHVNLKPSAKLWHLPVILQNNKLTIKFVII